MPDVRLVDLEVIRRFSLAVRQEHADAEELLAALDADRATVQKALKPARSRTTRPASKTRSGSARKTSKAR